MPSWKVDHPDRCTCPPAFASPLPGDIVHHPDGRYWFVLAIHPDTYHSVAVYTDTTDRDLDLLSQGSVDLNGLAASYRVMRRAS